MNKLEELVTSMNANEVKAFRSTFGQAGNENTTGIANGFDMACESVLKNGSLDKASIYKAVTGKKKFNDKEWRYIQTELTDRVENFLMLRYIQNKDALHSLIKYKALASRNCFKAANYFYDELNNKTLTNAEFFLYQSDAAETSLMQRMASGEKRKDADYGEVLHNLDAFYLSKKLQLFCEVANYSNVMSVHASHHLAEEVKAEAMKKPFSDIPLISIYLHILFTLTDPAEENHFRKLSKEIEEHKDKLPVKELKDIYTYVKNYCIKKINQGNVSYGKTLFGIYTAYIEDRRLMYSEYFSQFEFKNIVSIALRLNEADWCRTFIKKYINYLPPAERSNALNYNQAYFYFQTRDFKMSIRKLRDVEFTDIVYQLDSRVILLKSYFELDEDDQFFYHASAFRLFILRNRHLSEYQKKINRNLIRFLTALRRNAGRESKILDLKKEIQKEKNVADLNWLLNKVDELL